MRFVSGSLVLLLLTLSCSSQPKDEVLPVSLKAASAPGAATAQLAQDATADCNAESFCTREYLPTTCDFNGQSFAGSNPCEAKKLVRRFTCTKGLKFVEGDVNCRNKAEEKQGTGK